MIPRLRALLLVCAAAVAISTNYTNHGPLLGLISAEFGLTSAEAGLISTMFFAGSALTMLLGGLLADRLGNRLVIGLGLAIVALTNLASGLASPSYPAFLVWRALGGVGAGTAFAGGASYARSVFTAGGSHLAQGLYGASFLLGSGSTLWFMPALAGPAHDWRLAFVLSGLGVAACWVAWAWLAPPSCESSLPSGSGLGVVLRARNAWLLALCHMCGFGLAIVVSTWATSYLQRGFALSLAQAGALGSILLATGIAARSLGGLLLEGGLPPFRLIRLALTTAALGLGLMAWPESTLIIAVLGLLLTGLGAGLPYAAVFNGAAASLPQSPASAQAFVGWGASLFTLVGPPLIGALLDVTGSFSAGFGAMAVFVVLVAAATSWLQPFSLRPVNLQPDRPPWPADAGPRGITR